MQIAGSAEGPAKYMGSFVAKNAPQDDKLERQDDKLERRGDKLERGDGRWRGNPSLRFASN